MHYVSLIVEFLRGRPAVVFWTVALTQAMLWTLIPALFYSAPPGEVPLVLAIGHEFVLGSYLGPPLAFWLGEIAFRIAGPFGLYALAQACVVTAYWAVFALGRGIVGTRHTRCSRVLLYGRHRRLPHSAESGFRSGHHGCAALGVGAAALLACDRRGRRGSWFLLALFLGLLLLAYYVGLILIALVVLFTLTTARGRRALTNPGAVDRGAAVRLRGVSACRLVAGRA